MIKKVIHTFTIKVLTALISLGVAILISQWLGANGKGVQSLFVATFSITVLFAGLFGLLPLSYLIPRKATINYYIISNIWSIIAACLVFIILKNISIVQDDFIYYITILTYLASVSEANLSIYLIREKLFFYNIAFFIQPASLIILLFIFYKISVDFTIFHFIHAYLISFIVQFIVSLRGARRYIKEIKNFNIFTIISDSLSMLRYGFFNQSALIFQMIALRGSFYILEKFSTLENIGIYSNAVAIVESIRIINRSLALILFSRIINSENKKYNNKLFKKFSILSFWSQVAAILILIIIPNSLYTFLFGKDFSSLKNIIILLIPGIIFYGQYLISNHYFSGVGKHHINMISNIINMSIVLSLSYILIPKYSLLGAAIATNIAYLSLFLFQYYFINRTFKISYISQVYDKEIFIEYFNKLKIYLANRK